MKKILLFVAVLAIGNTSFAQSAEDQNAMMEKWMAYMTPGDMHKMLAKQNGVWEAKSKMWMAPGAEPMETTGELTTDMHLGDRYQKSTYTSEFMGMPFEGVSTTAYDNARKVFINTWMDNTGTSIMYSEGQWNEETKTIEFKGMATDAMAGKQMPFREVITMIDDDHYKMEMYNTMADGKELRSMEIMYTRK